METKWIMFLGTALVGAALTAAVYGGLLEWPSPPVADSGQPAAPSSVERSHVVALGRIEPASEIIDVGSSLPETLSELLVAEGDWVEAGAVLARLDSHAERVADRNRAQAQLDEALALREAELDLGNARIREKELRIVELDAAYPLDVSKQEARIRRLEAVRANSQLNLDSKLELSQNNFASSLTTDDQRTRVRETEEDLAASRTGLEQIHQTYDTDSQVAQAELAEAKAALARALVSLRVKELERNLELAEERIGRAVISAPVAGAILEILVQAGERSEAGTILKMGDTRSMHAVAEVYETDIQFVAPGQPAIVTSPALSRPLAGRVVAIGHLIGKNDVIDVDPASDVDARVVEVRIELEPDDLVRRLTNLTVDVRIDISGASGETVTGMGAGAAPDS